MSGRQPEYTNDRLRYECEICQEANVYDTDGNIDFSRIGGDTEEHSCWVDAWMEYNETEAAEAMLLATDGMEP
jgi:hypothetical protein